MECKIIAHRGANKKAPQNTMPAFRQAVEDGADGFETDVHLTRDGKLVICHNYAIDATSDGRGLISDYTFDELRTFDFGSYFAPEFRGTQAPSLEEFLQLAKEARLDPINVELKSPRAGRRMLTVKTLEAIKAAGLTDRVIISSFDPRILRTVKCLEPACRTGFLYPCQDPRVSGFVPSALLCARSIRADYIHPAYIVVSRALVLAAHRLGLGVNVWTVDDPRTAAFLISCGVDGIITDCPAEVRGYAEAAAAAKKHRPAPGLLELPTAAQDRA